MDALEIRLPDFLRERLRLTGTREASVLETETLLLERARQGSSVEPMFTSCPCTRRTHVRKAQRVTRNGFLDLLAKVTSDPPLRGDELPRLVRGSSIAF